MSIIDIKEKIKSQWVNTVKPEINNFQENFNIKTDIFIALVIILVGLAGFGLGKLSALEKGREGVQIKPFLAENTLPNPSLKADVNSPTSSSTNALGLVVAAKTGTKYYYPWCSGATRISEKNKIWFDSIEQAKQAGFSAASNCLGLK